MVMPDRQPGGDAPAEAAELVGLKGIRRQYPMLLDPRHLRGSNGSRPDSGLRVPISCVSWPTGVIDPIHR
jgi:hypothetical protein